MGGVVVRVLRQERGDVDATECQGETYLQTALQRVELGKLSLAVSIANFHDLRWPPAESNERAAAFYNNASAARRSTLPGTHALTLTVSIAAASTFCCVISSRRVSPACKRACSTSRFSAPACLPMSIIC